MFVIYSRIDTIFNINILLFKLNTTFIKSFLLIISTCYIISKIFVVIEFFQIRAFLINCIFALLIINKNIFKTISILVLANKNIFYKNQIFFSLFKSLKSIITIL